MPQTPPSSPWRDRDRPTGHHLKGLALLELVSNLKSLTKLWIKSIKQPQLASKLRRRWFLRPVEPVGGSEPWCEQHPLLNLEASYLPGRLDGP